MISVNWFANDHEHRNDWLRFGLMRLHVARELRFEERPLAQGPSIGGFDEAVAAHAHRHTSVIAIRSGGYTVRTIVDSEDSFFWMSPLVRNADIYFCAGYNRDFFVNKNFTAPYPWQSEAETAFYRQRAQELIASYGDDFSRVRPFAPIGPALSLDQTHPHLIQKVRNLYHRASTTLSPHTPWLWRYLDFEARYRAILALRNAETLYDVVLRDTLWGWPRHRIGLHRELRALARRGYAVHAQLRWADPTPFDDGLSCAIDKTEFPMETGHVDDYETMLGASRVGVFATGFHYGWRNIVTLTMMLGLPIYADPFLIEHCPPLADYVFSFNTSGDWRELPALLDRYQDANALRAAKTRNQGFFDRALAPEAVARTFLAAALDKTPAGLVAATQP